jgi:hypothetical protein
MQALQTLTLMPGTICCTFFLLISLQFPSFAQPHIENNAEKKSVKIQDGNGNLMLTIHYDNKVVVDRLQVFGEIPVSNDQGIFSAVKVNENWFTTRSGIQTPNVTIKKNSVVIENIFYGEGGNKIKETWILVPSSEYIDWTIERQYPGSLTLEDTGFPQWSFNSMETWTGALLGTGGVAWCKLFNRVNASYANHTGEVALWNQTNKSGLRITPVEQPGQYYAIRFSRQPDNKWTLNHTVSKDRLNTKHALTRFIRDKQDIWDSVKAQGKVRATYRLQAFNYDQAYYRGDFPGLNGESIRAVLNTIARVGVIDEYIIGSNNWHLSAGFAVLHEQWIAQMGLAINDPNYLENYQKTLDYFRDNAISADGRVKSRWAYVSGDHEPGTYDEKGFYEAQWGRLLDSNTDQVINVAELFHMNGDIKWVQTHKSQCEKVLEFLLQRDSDNDGLVEAMTDSYKEKKGSDWIDVIWASYENAFLNAKMYEALIQWARVERILGDSVRANDYLKRAGKLKRRFNQTIQDGGFWDPENKWYVYWRDKDDTIHGNNLVTPVNFMAIAYGICDDKNRQASILNTIEKLMQEEELFMWPISFFPFEADEGLKVNYPFPNYENGHIFLGWGEVGIRAYSNYDVNIPVKYISNVLAQYEKDGLAHQRYDRKKGLGRGSDILANNALPVVGLYRNIFGIQPKYNRLYLHPHITKELNGTKLKYWLRDQYYTIQLSAGDHTMSAGSLSINSSRDFSMHIESDGLTFFNAEHDTPDMKISRNKNAALHLKITDWARDDSAVKKWSITTAGSSVKLKYEIFSLKPNSTYSLLKNGKPISEIKSDNLGKMRFSSTVNRRDADIHELKLLGTP